MGDVMRVLVTGASGLLGAVVAECFSSSGHSVMGTYNLHALAGLARLEIRDRCQVMSTVRTFHPDLIVHAAAMPNVDLCEVERGSCYEVNIVGTQHIIESANIFKAKLVFFSSDYIFDGKSGPYSEESAPNPINFYGACKLEAEDRIRKQLRDFVIIRTTVVYGWERQGKNFVLSTIAKLKRGEEVRVPIDQVGTPTYANNIAEALVDLVRGRQIGVFNVVGPELMDRYTFAKLVAETFGLSEALLIPTRTADIRQIASRPLMSGLKTDKLRSVSRMRMVPPKEGLCLMRESREGLV
jgi:dTDP-4-dehydrorhamnose reductase